MKKTFRILFALLPFFCSSALAQGPPPAKPNATAAAITANSTPIELARAALAAQGGDKFKNLKSTMLVGTVDLYPPGTIQSTPGKFVIIIVGDKMRIDIDATKRNQEVSKITDTDYFRDLREQARALRRIK